VVGETKAMEWWSRSSEQLQGIAKKGLNSLITLGLWTLWNHRNICVFDRVTPSLEGAIRLLEELRKKLLFGILRGPSILPLLQLPFQVSCRALVESPVGLVYFLSSFSSLFLLLFFVVFVFGLILDPSS
jgi:hypothetical protein